MQDELVDTPPPGGKPDFAPSSRLWAATRAIPKPFEDENEHDWRRRGSISTLLRRHCGRHHDGVSHPVNNFFVRRNNGRQNASQNDFPRRNHEIIRTKTNPTSQNPDFTAWHVQVFLFEKAASIEPLQNIWIR